MKRFREHLEEQWTVKTIPGHHVSWKTGSIPTKKNRYQLVNPQGKPVDSFAKLKDAKKAAERENRKINEALKASDPAGKWIKDFVHSDNERFSGKSKKKRIKMALGAYYNKQREK